MWPDARCWELHTVLAPSDNALEQKLIVLQRTLVFGYPSNQGLGEETGS